MFNEREIQYSFVSSHSLFPFVLFRPISLRLVLSLVHPRFSSPRNSPSNEVAANVQKSFCFCCCRPVRMGRTILSSSSVRKMTTAARRFTFSFFLLYPFLFHSSQSSLNVQKFSLTGFRGRNATVFVLLTNERNQRELSFSLVCFLFRIVFILVRLQANGLAVHRNRNVGNHGVENREASLLEVSRWWNEKICDGFSLARSFASRPLLVPFSL